MKKSQLLKIARNVLSTPTVPLHEDGIKEVVRRFCRARPALGFVHDRWGNLIVRYRRGQGCQPVVFEAHMDHPGFEILEDAEKGEVRAKFLGGVHLDYIKGSRVKVFCHAHGKSPVRERHLKGVSGVVTSVDAQRWAKKKEAILKVNGPVRRGDFAVWDLRDCELRDGLLYARACDDLIGCVSMLAMLDELVKRRVKANVSAVFTRAEEIGFLGALAVSRDRMIPASAIVVGIETSREIAAVKMGNGPIIRVGDRSTIFNSDVTFFLTEVALRLKAKNPKFKFQRALMDGGTCNSTVFHQQGYRTGAVCVALGNYHNHGERGKIREEFIALEDVQGMVELFVEIVREANEFEEVADSLTTRLNQLYQTAKRQLTVTR